MTKSIVQEAKDAIKQRQPRAWYINFIIWAVDMVAMLSILTLAATGAYSLIESGLDRNIKIGIATIIVGVLSVRLLERVFPTRR